jgi:pimeloyl-ACP methyl ester carboxylesterase
MELLPVPGYRKLLSTADDGFKVPVIFFPASGTVHEEGKGKGKCNPRPTVILGNGFDGSMEELYHLHGAAALERGYNVVCYEGPGQPVVRREQGLGFTHEWHKVVGPVLDYLETLPCVDMQKVGLLGYSMAGVLAARAAALEPRVKACKYMTSELHLSSYPWILLGIS